jgi:P-loop containing dynein motor region
MTFRAEIFGGSLVLMLTNNGKDRFFFSLQGYELDVPKAHVKLNTPMMPAASGATVFDWFFDKATAEWRMWSSSVPAASIQDDAKFSDIYIPTVDSVRYTFLLDLAVRQHQPFLFVGPTGDTFHASLAVFAPYTLPVGHDRSRAWLHAHLDVLCTWNVL